MREVPSVGFDTYLPELFKYEGSFLDFCVMDAMRGAHVRARAAVLLLLCQSCAAAMQGAARVRGWLEAAEDKTTLPLQALSDQVRYTADVGEAVVGAEAYIADARRWGEEMTRELEGYHTTIERCEQLSTTGDSTLVAVRWRAAWAPESQRPVRALAALARWRVESFELDAREESRFSWGRLGRLFLTAARTGTLRLPEAAVRGRSLLRLDAESGAVLSVEESLDVVGEADGGRLKNRRVAADAAIFLDFRRPSSADPDDWAAAVASRVLARTPGAGSLDIEPLEDDAEAAVALGGFAAITAVALAISIQLLGQQTGVFGFSPCDDVANSDAWYAQCVSDLFGG